MLQLTQGQTDEKIVVTLTELSTLNDPYFLFVFTHVTTKAVVNIIVSDAQDESDYPERFNQFTIDTNALFNNQLTGEWLYTAYEQSSPTNTETTGLNVLENGKLRLYPSSQFSYTQYNSSTTYKAYNG